jgi:hypothetical protein
VVVVRARSRGEREAFDSFERAREIMDPEKRAANPPFRGPAAVEEGEGGWGSGGAARLHAILVQSATPWFRRAGLPAGERNEGGGALVWLVPRDDVACVEQLARSLIDSMQERRVGRNVGARRRPLAQQQQQQLQPPPWPGSSPPAPLHPLLLLLLLLRHHRPPQHPKQQQQQQPIHLHRH